MCGKSVMDALRRILRELIHTSDNTTITGWFNNCLILDSWFLILSSQFSHFSFQQPSGQKTFANRLQTPNVIDRTLLPKNRLMDMLDKAISMEELKTHLSYSKRKAHGCCPIFKKHKAAVQYSIFTITLSHTFFSVKWCLTVVAALFKNELSSVSKGKSLLL